MIRIHLAVAFAALMSSCFVNAAQLKGAGELLAIRCSEAPGSLSSNGAPSLINCVGIVAVAEGPKAFALDKPYNELVGTHVTVVSNGKTHSLQ